MYRSVAGQSAVALQSCSVAVNTQAYGFSCMHAFMCASAMCTVATLRGD